MSKLHPVFQAQLDVSTEFAGHAEGGVFQVDFDGTALVWLRDGFMLSFRGENQALPNRSSPLQVLGGPIISGQGWYETEIAEFRRITGADAIFERPCQDY